MSSSKALPLQEFRVPVQLKLSLLWTATMFCYVYGDYFALYIPGKLVSMQAGSMGPLGQVTQGVLLGTGIMMAIPALMTAFSLLLKARVNRVANIVLGAAYAVIMLLAAGSSSWNFYRLFGAIEIALTLTIVWQAWCWPRAAAEDVPT